jgi:hypothetical protein
MRESWSRDEQRDDGHACLLPHGGGGKNGSYLIQVLSITPRYVRGPWSSP